MGCSESKNYEKSNLEKLLRGKTALITGGTRGLGKTIVTLFALHGANIVFNGSSPNPKAEEFAKETSLKYGVQCYFIVCNIRKEKEIDEMVEFAKKKFQTVDILINNAGKAIFGDVQSLKLEDLNECMEINLTAPMLFAKKCIPMMKEKNWGRIINFTSSTCNTINNGHTAYTSAKYGVEMLTKVMAKELGSFNITVNCISPGYMDTDMFIDGIKNIGNSIGIPLEEVKNGILTPLCVKELIDPKKIAEHTLFLCTDSAKYQTGSISYNDCGYGI